MIDRWRRLPEPVQDGALALLLGTVWFGCAAYWEARGWRPRNAAAYDLAGAASVVAFAVRRLAPAPLLVAAVFVYPVLYDVRLQSEFHLLPVLIVAYAAARRNAVPAVLVSVSCVAAGLLLSSGALHDGTLEGVPWFGDWSGVPFDDPGGRAPRLPGSGPRTPDWSGILFDSFAIATMVLLGVMTAAHRRTAAALAARNVELERLRGIEAGHAVAQERTRIARELHDDVAHHLTALIVRAQAAERVAGSRPDVAVESVGWIAETARHALTSMRQTVAVLRSDGDGPASLAPGPSLDDLPPLVARFREAGIDVQLTVPPQLPPLDPQAHHAAVRIVQEALTNVLRHSGARHVIVSLDAADNGLTVAVEDDGSGSRVGEPVAHGGHGLLGMRERTVSCGGRLDVDSGPLGGWRVRAWFPCAVPVPRP